MAIPILAAKDAQLVGGIMWILQGAGKEFQYSIIECRV
jgi:hypothetical protein